MKYQAQRQEIVDVCQQLVAQKLVVGTAGNVSIRIGDEVLISPSAVPYADLTPGDIGIHDMDGKAIEAKYKPSSELPLHLSVYKNTDAKAITHTHAVASTTLGTVVDEVPVTHYYSMMFGGPIRVSRYAHAGSEELAKNVTMALRGRCGALMANHGAITIGETLSKAFDLLPYLEYVCEVVLRGLATGLPLKELDAYQQDYTRDMMAAYVPHSIDE